MLKYMLLLCCLYALTEAVPTKPRKLSPRETKLSLKRSIKSGLKDSLTTEHLSFRREIALLNRITTFRQAEFDPNFKGRLISYKPFVKELIKDSENIYTKYPRIHGPALEHRLFEDIKETIKCVPDPKLQQQLLKKATQLKHDKDAEKKLKLFRSVQHNLNRLAENNPNEEIRSRASFGSIGNQALMCTLMPELYRDEENVDKHIKRQLKVLLSGPLIDKKTAQRYAADNTPFFSELVTVNTIFTTPTATLCDRAEDQIQQVPNEELKNELTETVLNHLKIEMRD